MVRNSLSNESLIASLLLAAVLLLTAPALAQAIPGSEGWLVSPEPGQNQPKQKISELDVALTACHRAVIATGQFFLGDVNYVLGRCQQPLAAWVADCERREGQGAPICLLGPQQAVGDALRDAWVHRQDLKGWLASLPPLPNVGPDRTQSGPDGAGAAR